MLHMNSYYGTYTIAVFSHYRSRLQWTACTNEEFGAVTLGGFLNKLLLPSKLNNMPNRFVRLKKNNMEFLYLGSVEPECFTYDFFFNLTAIPPINIEI